MAGRFQIAWHRLKPAVALAVGILLVWLALDAAVFRSGLYTRYLEPESTAGTTERTLLTAKYLWRRDKKNVLVIGDSRVAEGFSAQVADQGAAIGDLNFIGAGMSGTTPRVWDFFLKVADPKQDRFRAVVIMTSAFADGSFEGDQSNRSLDLNYLSPILRIEDGPLLANSFSDPDLKRRVWRNILLPAEPLQADIRSFLDAPIERIKKARVWRRFPEWSKAYRGRDSRDPELADLQNGRGLQQVPEAMQKQLLLSADQAKADIDTLPSNQQYRADWFGRIATRYASAGVPVLIFLMPRGPYYAELGRMPVLSGSLKSLSDAGLIHVLNPNPELALEHPQYFFDNLHLNAQGRIALSAGLSQQIREFLR